MAAARGIVLDFCFVEFPVAQISFLLCAMTGDKVIAIVVSHNPERHIFEKLLSALLPQVTRILIVDNASSCHMAPWIVAWLGQGIELQQMTENVGIAAAQNAGIKRAMELGADFVLLSDQDSVPSASMVADLLATALSLSLERGGTPVAAVGPATVDSRTGQASFFVIERAGMPRRWQPPANIDELPARLEVGFLIASGTLIPVEVIKHIGAMRSNYFIDHVDTEWCFRARAAGYRLVGVPTSRLQHQLGDSVRRVWFFGSRQVMYHSPLRDYYMFRNTLLMLRETPMSLLWQVHFLWRLVQFAGYFLVFAPERGGRLRRMALGILHALKGVSGCLDTKTHQCSGIPVSDIEPATRGQQNGRVAT